MTTDSSITRATSAIIPRTVDDVARLAKMAHASGLAKVSSPEAAGVIILTGAELGLSPMQSLRGIYVIDGKPVLSADLMVAIVKRADVCEWWRTVESTADVCTIATQRVGEPAPTEKTWRRADAERAGVASKQPWRQYPAQMLRHRCAADLAREVYPDVMLGLYTPDEMEPADVVVVTRPASERPAPLPAPAAPLSLGPLGIEAPRSERARDHIADASRAVGGDNPTLGEHNAAVAEADAMDADPVTLALAALDAAWDLESYRATLAVLVKRHHPGGKSAARGTHPVGPNEWTVINEHAAQRRAALSTPTPDNDPPKGRRSPRKTPAADATGDGASSEPAPAAEAVASRERVASLGGVRAYLASKTCAAAVETATRAHGRHVAGFIDAAVERLDAITPADHHGARVTEATLRRRVEQWASEGPVAQMQRAA